LVRAGYDGLTATDRQLDAGRGWGQTQPAGLAVTARRWEAFGIDPAGGRKVLPLTEEAVNRGITLTSQGVAPHVAEQVVVRLRPALKSVQFDVFDTPEQLLPHYPKALHDHIMAAEAMYDPALDRVIVIASNLELRNGETGEQAATRACLHEAVVHYGVRKALGEQADSVFTRVRAQAAAGFDGSGTGAWTSPEREAFRAVMKNDAYKHLSPARQGEEILARLQETHEPKQPGALQRGVAACRLALGNVVPGLNLSGGDVDYLLWRGRQEAGRELTPKEEARRATNYYRAESAWVDQKLESELKSNPNGASRTTLTKLLRPIWTKEWAETHPETPMPKFILPKAEVPEAPEEETTSSFRPVASAHPQHGHEPELEQAYRGPSL